MSGTTVRRSPGRKGTPQAAAIEAITDRRGSVESPRSSGNGVHRPDVIERHRGTVADSGGRAALHPAPKESEGPVH